VLMAELKYDFAPRARQLASSSLTLVEVESDGDHPLVDVGEPCAAVDDSDSTSLKTKVGVIREQYEDAEADPLSKEDDNVNSMKSPLPLIKSRDMDVRRGSVMDTAKMDVLATTNQKQTYGGLEIFYFFYLDFSFFHFYFHFCISHSIFTFSLFLLFSYLSSSLLIFFPLLIWISHFITCSLSSLQVTK
jgi:hypothetical protein